LDFLKTLEPTRVGSTEEGNNFEWRSALRRRVGLVGAAVRNKPSGKWSVDVLWNKTLRGRKGFSSKKNIPTSYIKIKLPSEVGKFNFKKSATQVNVTKNEYGRNKPYRDGGK